MIKLGLNIDHVATLRQARGARYPNVVRAALICEEAAADAITLHLREDRRHIQDADVEILLDMAADDYADPVTAQQSKQLMRMLLNHHLGGKTLHTRELIRELQKP